MNKIGIYITLATILVISTATIVKTDCDVKVLKNELSKELRPDFKYDSSNISKFSLTTETQEKEIKVPLFSGEKYKMLFNTAALPSNFEIQIFDKPKTASNRKLLFSVKDSEELTEHTFSYEPKKPRTMYVNYILPASEEEGIYGCAVFLMGYKVN
jgi:hypothetical protein